MNYLLDTHTFIWAVAEPKKLPGKVVAILEEPASHVAVSAVSFWEIAMKARRKTLDLGGLKTIDLFGKALAMNLELISVDDEESASIEDLLERSHYDPFDRMLVWQAIRRNLTLLSADATLKRFEKDGLRLLWK